MKLLHTMIRVKSLDASIHFYSALLGMKLLDKKEFPGGRFTLAFVGYGPTKEDGCIELTYNWDQTEYELGNGFGHIAIGVKDIYKTCDRLRENGAEVVRLPGPMKHGTTVIAFVLDPNGYQIELIEM